MREKLKLIIVTFIVFSNIILADTIILTPKEKNYLNNNPIIKVHNETNWPPYNYNKDGKSYGYSIEYMKLLASKVDINIKFISGYTWNQFIDMIKNNEIDIMLNIAKTPQREKFLSYTSRYYSGIDVVFTKNNIKYKNLKDLNGKTIAIVKGFYEEELIRTFYPSIKLITVNNSLDAIKSVSFGRADGAIDNLATGNYIISKYQLSNIKPSFEILDKRFDMDLYLATNKKNTILRDILEKAKKKITEEELNNLKKIWLLNSSKKEKEDSKKLNLTISEKKYLLNKKIITMCIDPNWMPFEKFDKNGDHIGMTADYFKIFQDDLGIKINVLKTKNWNQSLEFVKKRKCDILSLAMETKTRKEYLNFTTPYLKIPLVLATRINVPFVNDISAIVEKKIGITKGYAFIELLKQKYKNINIVEVENIQEGLLKVDNGELFGYIGTLASVGHQFQTGYSGELKITGKLDETWALGIGVRNDDLKLLSIFQKIIDKLDIKQQQNILNSWISIKYEKGIDYTLIWQILAVVSFVLLLGIYKQYLLKMSNNELSSLNKKLKLTKEELNKAKEYFEYLFNNTIETIGLFQDNRCINLNEAGIKLFEFKNLEDSIGKSPFDFIAPQSMNLVKKNIMSESQLAYEAYAIKQNKEIFPVLIRGQDKVINNKPTRIISLIDLTDLKNKELIIVKKSKELNNSMLLMSKYIIYSKTDLNGLITEVSDAFCEISQYTRTELLGKSHKMLSHKDMNKSAFIDMWKSIKSGKSWNSEIKNRKKDDSYYWLLSDISPDFDENGNIFRYVSISQDITDKKKVENLAITDGLTTLYNRRYFDNIFPQQIALCKRKKELLAFVIMDIDHFKLYNDTYGHLSGDIALKLVSKSMNNTMKRPNDYVFRLGGEEFGLIYTIKDIDEALLIANKVRKNIENLKIDHINNSTSKFLTISSGLYIIKENDKSLIDEIYKKADEALYVSKENGRNQVNYDINKILI